MAEETVNRTERYFFYIVMAISAIVAFILVRGLLQVVILSVMAAIVFRPLYLRYLKWLGERQGLSITLTIITMFIVVIVPATIVATMTIRQGAQFAADITGWLDTHGSAEPLTVERIDQFLEGVPFTEELQITGAAIAGFTLKVVTSVVGWLAGQLASFASSIPGLIMNIMLFIGIVSALLPGWPALMQIVRTLSPLRDEWDQIYIGTLERLIGSMIKAAVISITLQGILMTIFLAIAGVPYLAFWFVLSTAVAITPIGCSLVAFPIGIVLILLGDVGPGLIVILGYIIVVANVSAVVNPMIVRGKTQLNQALIMIALFGGLIVFGLPGVFYGPILLAFIMTTLQVYLLYFRGKVPQPEPIAEPAASPVEPAQSV